MAIEIQEKFQVAAPVEKVWAFMMSPENVVTCLPGATLDEIIDEDSFVGGVKVKIGAITARYKGQLSYTKRDKDNFTVEMLAEAKEKGGGTVSGTIKTRLVALDDGGTQVQCDACGDLTGRILQVGRGMIEGVSAQIIKKYIANVRRFLEVPEEESSTAADDQATQTPTPPEMDDSINIIAIVFTVIRDSIAGFFKRLFGRK